MRRISSVFLRSFLQGLILLSPIAITAYLLYSLFVNVDSLVPFVPRGVGFVIIIGFVTVVGYLGTRFFLGRWLFDSFGHVMENTPGVKYIYSSLKDMISSFVGDKKKFSQPVWVRTSLSPEMWRIGLTQPSMDNFGMLDKVAVYLPHSYAISGWVIVAEKENVKPVTTMSAAEAMKFAVSGGITNATA